MKRFTFRVWEPTIVDYRVYLTVEAETEAEARALIMAMDPEERSEAVEGWEIGEIIRSLHDELEIDTESQHVDAASG